MKQPLYRQALSFGWRFAWQHKFLWIYGLFAAALGHMGVFDILAKVSRAMAHAGLRPMPQSWGTWQVMRRMSWQMLFETRLDWVWALWLILVGLGFLAFFTVLAVVSQGALIHAAAQGKTGRGVAMDSREWHAGVNHFWRLFFLNAAKKVVIGFLAAVVGWAAVVALRSSAPTDLLSFLLLFLLSTIVGLALSFLVIYAAGYVVVEEYPFGEALVAAWRLFLRHWLVSLEVGALFLVLNIALAFFVVIALCLLLLPAALLWFAAIVIGNALVFAAAVVFLFLSFVALIMLLGALFTVFSTSVWTYLFMHMHRYGIKSRLVHWLS